MTIWIKILVWWLFILGLFILFCFIMYFKSIRDERIAEQLENIKGRL